MRGSLCTEAPAEDTSLPKEDSTLLNEESSLTSEQPAEASTLPSDCDDPTILSEVMTLLNEDPALLFEDMTILQSVTPDSSEKSSVLAPSISPLHSYSCGSPSPFSSPSPTPSLFESEEAAAACASLDELDPDPVIDEPLECSTWCGMKLVTDNVDFNITPSFQRVDKVKQSLHYVHTYGVKDRVDLSSLSDDPPKNPKHDANDLMPSTGDVTRLKEVFCILLSR